MQRSSQAQQLWPKPARPLSGEDHPQVTAPQMKPARPMSRSMQQPNAAVSHQPIERRRPCLLAAKATKPKQNTSKGLENEKLCQ
jgi:hypothetical protein